MNNENWFEIKEEDEAQKVLFSTIDTIKSAEKTRYDRYKQYAELYLDKGITGFLPGEYTDKVDNLLDEEYTWNACRACTDTLHSKIGNNVPKAKILTSGAKQDTQEKAITYEKLLKAISFQERQESKERQALKDALLCGIGIIKVFPKNNNIKIEKIHPTRILVDNNAFLNGQINEIYQIDYISKNKLLEMFPDKKDVIDLANENFYGKTNNKKLITVYEAWYLAEGDIKGRHAIITDNGVLLLEDYEDNYLPFAFIRYADDLLGFYGIGLIEQLSGIQREISYIISKIRENVNLLAVPYILKHKTSKIPDEFLSNNESAKIIEWEGNIPPSVITPPAMNPQVFQYLYGLWDKAFETSGLSQLTATSQKPAGLNSGVALRNFYDIESIRFSSFGRAWENFIVDVAKLIIHSCKYLESVNMNYVSERKDKVEEIILDDLSTNDLTITVSPTSSLPDTASGRLEMVQNLINLGLVNQNEARTLLNFPDLDKSSDLANAEYNLFEKTFEKMLMTGNYIEPIPYQNLELGIKIATKYYSISKIEDVEESKIDLIVLWINDAAAILNPEQPTLPQMEQQLPVAPPMGPTGPPQMPLPPGIYKPGTKLAPEMIQQGPTLPPIEGE